MPAKSAIVEMPPSVDDIIDLIAIIHRLLDAARQRAESATDREAILSQMTALSKLWRKLDVLRLAEVTGSLKDASNELGKITEDIRAASNDIKKVAKVIHAAAKAIAVAERVLKLIKP